MTNAPETDLDPLRARLRNGDSDWVDLGRRIRRTAARATVITLLEDATADAADAPDSRFAPER